MISIKPIINPRRLTAFLSVMLISVFPLAGIVRSENSVNANWHLSGVYTLAFNTGGTDYNHSMTIDKMNDGTGGFTGHGWYIPDTNYTWNTSGTISDSNISFIINYTGLNPGYTLNVMGQIASDGSMSGTATSNAGQSFTWRSLNSFAIEQGEDDDNEDENDNDSENDHEDSDFHDNHSDNEDNHGFFVSTSSNKAETAHSREGMPSQSRGHLSESGESGE